MPGRRIAALPFLDATIVLFPDDGHRQLTGERGCRGRHNGRVTGHRIGFHTDDQAARLEVPTKRGKLLLGRIDHDMQVAGNDANHCLMTRLSRQNTEVGEQVVDVKVVAMRVMATEATLRDTNRSARNTPCRCPRHRYARAPREQVMSCLPDPIGVLYRPAPLRATMTGLSGALGNKTVSGSSHGTNCLAGLAGFLARAELDLQ